MYIFLFDFIKYRLTIIEIAVFKSSQTRISQNDFVGMPASVPAIHKNNLFFFFYIIYIWHIFHVYRGRVKIYRNIRNYQFDAHFDVVSDVDFRNGRRSDDDWIDRASGRGFLYESNVRCKDEPPTVVCIKIDFSTLSNDIIALLRLLC